MQTLCYIRYRCKLVISDAIFVENDSTQNTSIQGTEVNLIGFNVYVGSSSVSLGSLGYYTFFVTTSHMFYS